MTKTVTSFVVWENFVDFDNNARNFSKDTPVSLSNIDTIYGLIKAAIATKNAAELKTLLTKPFIYSRHYDLEDWHSPNSVYDGNHHRRELHYESYVTRPVAEALFFEHSAIFRKLVAEIAECSEIAMHQALVNSFIGTDIPQSLLQPFSTEDSLQIEKGIQEISRYKESPDSIELETLPTEDSGSLQQVRIQHARSLGNELQSMLNAQPKFDDSANSKVNWLHYRFELDKKLHSKDPHFQGHLGWKRVITNVATILFSGAILNCINYAVTGNFLFCNQTKTQQLVERVALRVR